MNSDKYQIPQQQSTGAKQEKIDLFFTVGEKSLFKMTFIALLLLPLLAPAQTFQKNNSQQKFHISLFHWQGLTFGGQVHVREFEDMGTKFNLLKDLGMISWAASQGQLGYQLTKRHRFDIGYTRHSFDGSQLLPRDAWYNGTHLQANTWASIRKSRYYRLELGWQYTLLQINGTTFSIRPAIVYDHINFWVDAPVYQDTPRNETYEKFYKQQLPLPNLGFLWEQQVGMTTFLGVSMSGTYLPRLRTWMQEGGSMHIEQQNLDAKLFIIRRFDNTSLTASYHVRYFSLLEESKEDTNFLRFYGSGLTFGLSQAF